MQLSLVACVALVAGCGGQADESASATAGEVAIYHPTVEQSQAAQAAPPLPSAATQAQLQYRGGVSGVGVETAPKVYLVAWGSQWNSGDPSGEIARLQSFYAGIMGSSWLNSVSQYCQGVATGTVTCSASATHASNKGTFVATWSDNTAAAPAHPSQAQLAAEAVKAAQHFGNTTSASNVNTQYVIATAHNNNASGFGTQYCAYHSSTVPSFGGHVAYTNLPYITDAGASCGSGFVNAGNTKDGITIVSGHELAETITDQFPNGGWLDSGGAENGDKCAWISSGQGASQNVVFSTGTFPVQSLWSNAFSGNSGGCVISF
jgi:serine protease